jgi:hypothetical protein
MALDHEAIMKAYPSVVTIDDSGSKILDASGNTVSVEQSKIDAARVTLNAEYAALEYSRNRAEEYPSIEDQLDTIYHSGVAGWKTKIKAIKDKYPKPS